MVSNYDLSVNLGKVAEEHIAMLLDMQGIKYEFINDWYDFDVGRHKLEVKSCRLCISSGEQGYKIGRFDFTSEENRERQIKEEVWICFVLRVAGQKVVLGICRASKLDGKRYISLSQIRKYDLFTWQEWCDYVRNH